MSEEDRKKEKGEITRREFLKDAGFVVGGAAIGAGIAYPLIPREETIKEVEVPGPTVEVVKFVCPFEEQEFDTLAALTAHMESAHPGEELTKLTVNGDTHELKVEPNWSLLFVLREKLGFTGVKRGCEEATCGVCTVLMDGAPIYSCMTLAIECEGRSIETIEGLAPDGVTLHPIQQAFIENFGFECGVCTPGVIMTAKALLDKNPNPTEGDVRQALAGNLCKCASYPQIVSSVLAAAGK